MRTRTQWCSFTGPTLLLYHHHHHPIPSPCGSHATPLAPWRPEVPGAGWRCSGPWCLVNTAAPPAPHMTSGGRRGGWVGGRGGTGWVRGGWRRWCPLLPLLPLPLCAAKLPTTSPQLCHFSFVNPPFSVSPNSPNSTHSSSPPPNPRPLILTPPPPSLKPVNCWCDPFKPRRHSHCPHRVQERHLDWGGGV